MRPIPRLGSAPIAVGLATALLALLGGVGPATAYVRSYTTMGCHPTHWAQSCVFITTDGDGLVDMPLAQVEHDVQAAIRSWQDRTDPTSFLRLNYLPATVPRNTNALDRLQVVKFRSDKWCRPPDSPSGMEICYDLAAAAITTVTYQNKPADANLDGIIVDADIELNAVRNYFYDADVTPNPQPTGGRQPSDLWNTLTHELGHLQGFDHTCRSGFDGIPSCAVDSKGQQVLSCSVVTAGRLNNPDYQAIFDSTMYPFEDSRETKKRIPKADDLSAVISTYPLVDDPLLCSEPAVAKASGCSTTARPSGAALPWLGLAATLALLVARRRRAAGSR